MSNILNIPNMPNGSKSINDIFLDYNKSSGNQVDKLSSLYQKLSSILSSFNQGSGFIKTNFIKDNSDVIALKEIKQIVLNNHGHLDAVAAISMLEELNIFKELDSKNSKGENKEKEEVKVGGKVGGKEERKEEGEEEDQEMGNGGGGGFSAVHRSVSRGWSLPLSQAFVANLPPLVLPPPRLLRTESRNRSVAISPVLGGIDIEEDSRLGFFRGYQVSYPFRPIMKSRFLSGFSLDSEPSLYVQSWLRRAARVLLEKEFPVLVFVQANLFFVQHNNFGGAMPFLDTTQDIIGQAMRSSLLTQEGFLAKVFIYHVAVLQRALYKDVRINHTKNCKVVTEEAKSSKVNPVDLNRSLKYPFFLLTELLNEVIRYFPNEPNLGLDKKPDIKKCKEIAAAKALRGLIAKGLITEEDYDRLYKKFEKSEKSVIDFIGKLTFLIKKESELDRGSVFILSCGLSHQKNNILGWEFDRLGSDFVRNKYIKMEALVKDDRKTLQAVAQQELLSLISSIKDRSPLSDSGQDKMRDFLPDWYSDLCSDIRVLRCVENNKFSGNIALKNVGEHKGVENNLQKTIFILIDLSKSMNLPSVPTDKKSRTRIEHLKTALESTLGDLKGKDVKVSIIGFNSGMKDVSNGFLDLKDISEKEHESKVKKILDSCTPSGCTNFQAATDEMFNQIERLGVEYNPSKTLIFTITDGKFTNSAGLSGLKTKLQYSAALNEDAAVPLVCSFAIPTDQDNTKDLKAFMGPFLEDNDFAQILFKKMQGSLGINEVSELFLISDDADQLGLYFKNTLYPFVNLELPEVNINLGLEVIVANEMLSDNSPCSCEISLTQQDSSECALLLTYKEFKGGEPQPKGNIGIKVNLTSESKAGKSGGKQTCQESNTRLSPVLSLVSSALEKLLEINEGVLKRIHYILELEVSNLNPSLAGSGAGVSSGVREPFSSLQPAVLVRRHSSQSIPNPSTLIALQDGLQSAMESQSQGL